eukprot:gnl/TRDRNA2_/TRDRNA2_170155_c0_seq3.p2 gnl/TRDRNA2_/TRDRNA2_170155_c0~~gnl/TRDRNA2_/TRDRNA2_170155_c0_seq3.p2  ORF type:complete len:189 (+),score=36.52 gnl/TRDRNA2_/TRDRNA2_170155_c0_seq3:78-569(+)
MGQVGCKGDVACGKQCKEGLGLGGDEERNGITQEGGNEAVDLSNLTTGENKDFVSDAKQAADPNAARRPGRRPPFEVELVRTGEHWRTLGLIVSPDDDPRYLIVDEVKGPSLVAEWNATHPEAVRVVAGDIISSVNGGSCSGEEMLSQIQQLGKGATVKLRVE